MVKQVVCAVVLLAACGGGKKPEATTPDEGTTGGGEDTVQSNDNPSMVPPEKMEEITRLLDRKQRIMSRCLADAVDAQELPKNSRGRITLEIVISTAGSPTKVAVLKSTLESQKLQDCVVGHVRTIQFPTLPNEYPTSYTYAFEAM